MTAWSGKRTAFENYSVYAMFPDLAVYNSRNTILLYGTLIYMGIWLCFAWLRAQQSRRALEKNSEQARIISAISEIYCFTFLVNVQRGTVRIIKHPMEQLMKMDRTWSMNEVVQMQAAQNVAPDFREAFISYCDLTTLAQRLKENPNLTLEFRDPKEKVYLMTTLPQNYDRRGRLESVLMVTQDVTAEKERERDYQLQLKKTAEDAERANIVKTDFLRRMSHDIRTPINGVMGMLEIIKKNREDHERVDDCLEKIHVSSEHLLSLINDVLDMSKLESGHMEPEHVPFDLDDLMKNVRTLNEAQVAKTSIVYTYSKISFAHAKLIGSPLHLRQILLNLFSNAAKYNKENGTIETYAEEIACDENTATFRFTIRDTGIGMSEDFVNNELFEPFTQEKQDARTQYQGTGLGMSIVKELIEKMNGTITVESVLGEGSAFTVTLPFEIDKHPSAQAANGAADETALHGLKVLLAEDNELNMEIAEFFLEDMGAETMQAWNGKEAVEAFRNSAPGEIGVILMDIMMPVMDGLEAVQRIRALDRPDAKTVPIIAMTANAFSEDVERSRKAGMTEHLSKPLNAETLKKAILRNI